MTDVRRIAGFTLIELMVVVAVIAILAAVGYPAYTDAVMKGRRGQAKADLLEVTQLLERFRTVNNTYAGFNMTNFAVSPRTGTAFYNVALANNNATGFTLTATPIAGTPQAKDTKCGALSINQAGVKSIGGSATSTVAKCW